ncbi:TNT domain-containing protein [Cellulomonas soli]|uniref:TNT domain-containing protein n=1 Tax=Cellulomonas soli TaxID=931535 RepID=UPI0015CD3446|nr:TNT domain-containing protein [Cellulomonas soli]NYI58011.1 hypothetical protein [Cellulomonas soli]
MTADEALVLDRIGSEQGTDLWPSEAPFATRSLPPDRLALPRRTYRLVGDHPVIAAGGLLLETAVSAPWFGQPGGAPIYRFLDQDGTPLSVRELLAYRLLTDTTAQEIPA